MPDHKKPVSLTLLVILSLVLTPTAAFPGHRFSPPLIEFDTVFFMQGNASWKVSLVDADDPVSGLLTISYEVFSEDDDPIEVTGIPATITGTGTFIFTVVHLACVTITVTNSRCESISANFENFSFSETLTRLDRRKPSKVVRPASPCVASLSIEFEQIAAPLIPNPAANGGGMRIFPDADSPGGELKRAVGIKMQTTPPQPNADVFLRAFDVDDTSNVFATGQGMDNQGRPHGSFDPTSQTPQVQISVKTDAGGLARAQFFVSAGPGDNFKIAASKDQAVRDRLRVKPASRGKAQEIEDPQTNRVLGETGDAAVATGLLTIWRKMHIEVDDMGQVTKDNDAGGGVIMKESGLRLTLNRALPDEANRFENGRIKITSQTAEFEVKGVATGRDAEGNPSIALLIVNGTLPNSVSVSMPPRFNQTAKSFIKELAREAQRSGLKIKDKDEHLVAGSVNGERPMSGALILTDTGLQLTKSEVIVREDDAFAVKGNTIKTPFSQVELKSGSGRKKDSFGDTLDMEGFLCTSLVDDDDFNENDAGNLRGDVGEDVTGLDLSLIQTSDDPLKNVFAPAFILPVYDLQGNETGVPFVRNTPGDCQVRIGMQDKNLQETYKFDNKASENDENFWTIYLFGAYQDCSIKDGDPEVKKHLGRVDGFAGGQGANVFLEVNRAGEIPLSNTVNRAISAAHEIGHLFSADHPDGGLMAEPDQRSTGESGRRFSKESLRHIRERSHP